MTTIAPTTTKTLLRFATAGSVDDGKSTLVGRLLHDAKAILADQLAAVTATSAERGFVGGEFDFALVIGTAVALRWALWRWWPHGDRGPIPASPSGAAADGVDQSWIASWPPV